MNDLKRFVVTDQKLTVVYIAGPMSGLPQYNYPAFWYAADKFKAHGSFAGSLSRENQAVTSQCVVDKLLASQRKISKSLIIRLNFECDIEAAAAKASDARANA